jgi:hypothetical protein
MGMLQDTASAVTGRFTHDFGSGRGDADVGEFVSTAETDRVLVANRHKRGALAGGDLFSHGGPGQPGGDRSA